MTRVLPISVQFMVAVPQLIFQFFLNYHYRKKEKPQAEVGPRGEGADK